MTGRVCAPAGGDDGLRALARARERVRRERDRDGVDVLVGETGLDRSPVPPRIGVAE
jgi:hypothetical protein